MPHTPLRSRLHALFGAHRRAWALRLSLRAAAVAAGAIGAAVVVGIVFPPGEVAAAVRTGLVAFAILGLIAAAVTRFLALAPRFDPFLEALETRFPEVRSWLRNALDMERETAAASNKTTSREVVSSELVSSELVSSEVVSSELARALVDETARRVDKLPLATTTPRVSPRRPLLAMGVTAVVLVGLGVMSPQRAIHSWRTLWNPVLAAPPVRLLVEPGSVKVTPGATLTIRARVWGTPRVPALQSGLDAAAVAEGSGPEGARVWRFDLRSVTRPSSYRVRVAHVTSPQYAISLAGEPSPLSFEIEMAAPGYARLPVQRGSATRGDLTGLRGSRARVVATFDRDLERLTVTVPGGRSGEWRALTPRRWTGEVPMNQDGEYELHPVAESGEARYRYRITPLADAPPAIAVEVPSGDVDLPAGQRVPVSVQVQDDLGLSSLRLQYRTDPDQPWSEVPLSRFAQEPREAAVRSTWDASGLGLLPGGSATFRFEVQDNNRLNGPGRTVSPTFELKFPSLAELYQDIDRSQGSVHQTLEKAADQVRDLQKQLDKLGQRAQTRAPEENAPQFERSEELSKALERQQQLNQKIDEAGEQLRQTLESAAEREAFSEELTRKLQEMTELMKQIQSPEFREALRKMQQAMEQADRRPLEQSLPEWREQNRDLLKQLERTLKLLEQLRREEQLDALAQRADELKQQQDDLNRQHGETPKSDAGKEAEQRAEQQKHLADETQKLSQDTRQLAQKSEEQQDQKGLEDAAQELDQAAPSQRDASESARSQQRSQAKQKGQQASQNLERAAQKMQQMQRESEQRRQSLDLAAVRRAAQDLVSLQRESERNLNPSLPSDQRADRQTDLSEGVARVADSLATLAQRQPFITPKLGESLGRAMQSLSQSGRDLGGNNRARGEDAGRRGSTALNEAILELRQAESDMCQSPGDKEGGEQGGGKTGQQLGELGKQQSQLNRETRSVSERLTQQMRLSAGDQEQMRRLSERQRMIREQLQQIQKEEEIKRELLGRLDAAERDMQEAEEILERGDPSGELEQKQQRILSRLLDAQRSVNRRDFDPQRESRVGEPMAVQSAPELPTELLRENDRLRLDLLKADADRYPARYRAYIEAYLRALNGARPGALR